MKKHPAHIDPDLPAGVGDVLGSIGHGEDFMAPSGYFDHLPAEAALKVLRDEVDVEDSFFEHQASVIRMKAMEAGGSEEFTVPEGYFGHAAAELQNSVRPKGRIFNLRWITIPAAAAAIAGAIWLLRPLQADQENFADLLERTHLDVDDLEYFAEDEDVMELFLDYYQDTLIFDSTSASIDLVHDSLIFQHTSDSLNFKEGSLSKEYPKKPSAKEPVISFDELTEEEILEFLLEEGDDQLFDDL